MKITKHPTDNNGFNIHLTKFELEVLAKVSASLAGGIGKVREVFSDKAYSLLEQSLPFIKTNRKLFNVYLASKMESEDLYHSALYFEDIPLEDALNKQNKQNKRDKSGRFVTDKKYLQFRYLQSQYRYLTEDRLSDCHRVRDYILFDKRKIFNPYKKDGYLYGNDCSDGMKLKKFCLDKVFGRRYSDC